MLTLTTTVQNYLQDKLVRIAFLIKFDFASGIKTYWPGIGDFTSGGYTWEGRKVILTIDPGAPSVDGAAEPFYIGVNGINEEYFAKVTGDENEWMNRRIGLYLQFFDDTWQPSDDPISIRQGRMTGMKMGGTGTSSSSLMVNCEGSLVARGHPPLTFLSVEEQQRRYPGDKSAEFLPILQDKTVYWPK